jgi:beta-barrel assembly-enhancing protease
MQKATWYWVAGGATLIAVLAFVKWEMSRNRRLLTQEVERVIVEAPRKIAKEASQALDQVLTTNSAVLGSGIQTNRDQTQGVVGVVLDVAAKAGRRAGEILTSNSPPTAAGSGQASTQDTVGALLDLAAKTGQQLDRAGLSRTELSDKEEIELGNQLDRDILRQMPDAADPAVLAHLETLAKPLFEQRQRTQIDYRIRVVKSSQINAFGCAGGHIYLTTAFLRRFPSDGEWVMTLGHEMAHIELKHAVHKVQYEYHGQKVLGNLAKVGQVAYAVLSAPYSKEQEFEADAAGFDVCRKAGWSSDRLLVLFENLITMQREDRTQSTPSPEPPSELERRLGNYFSSHPETEDRLARLKASASK